MARFSQWTSNESIQVKTNSLNTNLINKQCKIFILNLFYVIFRSDQRYFSRHLCGWTFDRSAKDSFLQFLDCLCGKHEYTRAAMIAVFQLKIRLAIDILSKGADNTIESSNLRMAAIALSGFSFEKSAIWRSQCATAQVQISDPHLRALFAFLTPENGSYDKVLVRQYHQIVFFFIY